MNRSLSVAILCTVSLLGCSARAADLSPAELDRQADAILEKIPTEQRITLLAGIREFYTRDYPQAGLPEYSMSDGPIGLRGHGKATAYPSDILLAATWDPDIAQREGAALGKDSRARGVNILLGPAVNIYRLPQNGRNFEYMGEDPFLAGKIATGYINGVQSQGVAACVKHFACNNQENDRFNYNAIVDERALHEIYFPAFEAAIKDAHVRTIMCSYNRLNGTYASANKLLLQSTLRDLWKFDGLCVSDWGAVHETLGTLNDGVDLEMPSPKFFAPGKIKALMDEGKVTQATIDQKLRRVIRLGIQMGWNERPQLENSTDDSPQNDIALAVAREGITLLKNEGALLPLHRTKIKTLAVVGPGAADYVSGDGSSRVWAEKPVSVLEGIQAIAGPGMKIITVPTASVEVEKLAAMSVFVPRADGKPLKTSYFNNSKLEGEPVAMLSDDTIYYDWKKAPPVPGVTSDRYSVRWTGTINAPVDGTYIFATKSDDGSRVFLDGKQIVNNWRDQQTRIERAPVELKAGELHELVVEYYNSAVEGSMVFGWGPDAEAMTNEQLASIKSADAVVCCVRTRDTEGGDRSYDLPHDQQKLLEKVTHANSKTIVLLKSGGNVGMASWIDRVPALLDGFFAGQAGGTATAEILFGDINPSGHLPATFEKTWEDSFAHDNYPGQKNADGKHDVHYAEGIYVGYRYYDTKKIEPRFPFGHGLSYTTFKCDNLKVTPAGDDNYNVTVDVTNTGPRVGAAVTQLYVRPPAGADRPMQELKGFARLSINPGETTSATMTLNRRSFAMWDVETHDWKVTPGEYGIAIGQSSRAIEAMTKITVE